ncbi:MAG TPA: glycine cleavage system protein GcvH [Smithellaceae bacterium]|jgi:glycine cleavage system H protein|nr:glycine cleavage system protein GcvH [Syntrophaceae bacterium]NMC91550.1 glycine cleavage system protein GcvH [Smithella sp.]OQC74114.1 MAG: Glycine cleavage system H protein [Deltaproteobacteria bacterium ADurb.Bin002]HNV56013.1 glycine cleavage system protein GcvH [Smithellaceae bacterium]MBP8666938.1 glycine cleavage system protein GcvH [Syntrophaceae bacterium]
MKVFPEDLLYSREHVWVRVDGDMATLGITDYAQESLGEILSVEFPEIDTYVERDEAFGSIESTKAVVDLIASVSGTIVGVNEDINDDIGIVNSDPHDTGWLVVIEMDDMEQLDDLLDAAGYHDYILRQEAD